LDILMQRIEGLRVAIIADRDGVILFRASAQDDSDSISHHEDPTVYQALTTVFSTSAEHTEKVRNMGRMNYVVGFYEEGLILQVNYFPLVATFHASLNTNVGSLIALLPLLNDCLEDLRRCIVSCSLVDAGE